MKDIKLVKGKFEERLDLQFAPGIRAGFASPADDYLHESPDFNRDFIRHPEATFYGQVEGESMIEAGDIAVIDRSVTPSHGDVIVVYINQEYTF